MFDPSPLLTAFPRAPTTDCADCNQTVRLDDLRTHKKLCYGKICNACDDPVVGSWDEHAFICKAGPGPAIADDEDGWQEEVPTGDALPRRPIPEEQYLVARTLHLLGKMCAHLGSMPTVQLQCEVQRQHTQLYNDIIKTYSSNWQRFLRKHGFKVFHYSQEEISAFGISCLATPDKARVAHSTHLTRAFITQRDCTLAQEFPHQCELVREALKRVYVERPGWKPNGKGKLMKDKLVMRIITEVPYFGGISKNILKNAILQMTMSDTEEIIPRLPMREHPLKKNPKKACDRHAMSGVLVPMECIKLN